MSASDSVATPPAGRPRRPLRPGLVLTLLVPLLMPAAGAAAQDGGPPPTPVRVAPVVERLVQDRLSLTGEVRASLKSTVAADVEGRVLEVGVREGESVAAGAILARLDDTAPRLSLARLEARGLAAAAVTDVRQAELDRAELDLSRLEQLAADRASRPRELDDARAAVAVARARLAEAKADRQVIEAEAAIVADELADAVIRAPFDGVVIRRHTDPGRWMERGGEVVDLVARGRYQIWLDIPQRLRPALASEDATVGVRVDAADRSWPPARPVIVPLVDPEARTFPAYLWVDDPSGLLADGMSATGSVPAGQAARRTLVPRDALLQNAAGFYVFVVRETGQGPPSAMPATVRVLFDLDELVAVSGPLSEGDLVVVEGNERLFPMMPVTPVPADAADAADAATAAAADPTD